MYTRYEIFCWIWYSFLEKGFAVNELATTGRKPPLPTFTIMTQYSISFIFDFKEHRSQTAGPRKKPTLISICHFIAEKKLEFSQLFSEGSPALKNFWLRACKTAEILQRYMWGFLCDSNSFCKCLKQHKKCFVKRNVTPIFFLLILSLFFSFLVIASLNYGENLNNILQKEFFFAKSYVFLLSCNNYPVNCFIGISHMLQRLGGLFLKI